MNLRERRHDEQTREAGPRTPGGTDDLRARGEALLAAGNDAIDRALSHDSRTFLGSVEQQGGE